MQMRRYHVCCALWDRNDKLVQSIFIYSAPAGFTLCICIRIRNDTHRISFSVEGTKTISQSPHGGYVLRHLDSSKSSMSPMNSHCWSRMPHNMWHGCAFLCLLVSPSSCFSKTVNEVNMSISLPELGAKSYTWTFICALNSLKVSSNTGLNSLNPNGFLGLELQSQSTRILKDVLGS